ncbi:hypothetical protein [Dickeya poaceiphila]|uniref:hypothetical protein n=1 Tax=Dickeya poaceiphila TaxID=568768 RepID=UPI00039B63A5|nr:hypothetical protein [Dickeya poaceiphila]
MADNKKTEATETKLARDDNYKFCPICGSEMRQIVEYNRQWWYCDECGYQEPVD